MTFSNSIHVLLFGLLAAPARGFTSTFDPCCCQIVLEEIQVTCPDTLVETNRLTELERSTFRQGEAVLVFTGAPGECWHGLVPLTGPWVGLPADAPYPYGSSPCVDGTLSWCTGDCVPSIGRRQLEERAVSLDEGDEEYRQLTANCGDFYYQGYLTVVDTHLMVVGVPSSDDAITAGCPPAVATHAVFDGDAVGHSGAYHKEIRLFNDATDASFLLKDAHSLGIFKGSDVIRAHESVNYSKSVTGNKVYDVYDIITLNCADFLLQLARALHVKVDASMTSYVARRLLEESSKSFLDTIRKSANYFSLFGSNRNLGTVEITDQEVIELLVEKHTGRLLD